MAKMNKNKLNISKPIRLPLPVVAEIDAALNQRLNNKLISRREANYARAMELIGRTPEWKLALDKLAKLPKKEDLKW